ncbi:MAG: alpha-L-fucosidase [Armatimonadetes bacterium]|nr:alpha-L-fucosidase [Armatimonadota bacterium]
MTGSALLLLACGAASAAVFVPDGQIRPDDFTVLMAVDGRASDGLVPFQPGSHAKFYLQGWRRPEQQVGWTVSAATAAQYEAAVVIRRTGRQPVRVELTAAGQTLTATLPAEALPWWDRLHLDGRLVLPAGPTGVTLRLTPADGAGEFDAQVHAVELVQPAVRAELDRRALALRADPTWFRQARYGLMVHWTAQSAPLHGAPLPYDQAVAAFDVERFAQQAARTGAGLVVFTTAHALQYFPAPLAALDKALPGRTSRRDLVADLADALGRRGIRLMLYYHLGAANDTEWMRACGFWETDTSRLFDTWRAIVGEAGTRYGDKLAGWWFDDGSTSYYYRSAPWESLARAAKAGNPQRLVAFNAWELVNPTQFHDFCTGEGCQEPRGFCGVIQPGGDGRYPRGTHAGLQASACLITERDWGHFDRETPLPNPKWTADQLTPLLQSFVACGNVPIFNLEISQEGLLSTSSVELFERVRAGLR